ncbi:MAG TPA: XdhC/CoxI family protein [Candidatus Binataceae bacterium]|nr:XdhC/CoxI family protein [Candidatus Binataceae bacterium]
MNAPGSIWTDAAHLLERGEPFALATVVRVRGSTPREIGAKMLVHSGGQSGTIGGGCGEAEAFRKAQVLLEGREGARMVEVDLTGDFDQDEVGSCGGVMDVFIGRWTPGADLDVARQMADASERGDSAALLTVVDPGPRPEPRAGARFYVGANSQMTPLGQLPVTAMGPISAYIKAGNPVLLGLDEGGGITPDVRLAPGNAMRVFVDPVTGTQRLIVAGAGHIAMPLCAMAAAAGYRVTVIDDRASFANRERFPDAAEIIVAPFQSAIESLALDSNCALVSVTRGHAYDEAVVRRALMKPCGFVGMIASRRRAAAVIERLAQEGVPAARLAELHSPLGVAIGAETPGEIAVSILAEIIRERRTGLRDEFTLGVRAGRLKPTP